MGAAEVGVLGSIFLCHVVSTQAVQTFYLFPDLLPSWRSASLTSSRPGAWSIFFLMGTLRQRGL